MRKLVKNNNIIALTSGTDDGWIWSDVLFYSLMICDYGMLVFCVKVLKYEDELDSGVRGCKMLL